MSQDPHDVTVPKNDQSSKANDIPPPTKTTTPILQQLKTAVTSITKTNITKTNKGESKETKEPKGPKVTFAKYENSDERAFWDMAQDLLVSGFDVDKFLNKDNKTPEVAKSVNDYFQTVDKKTFEAMTRFAKKYESQDLNNLNLLSSSNDSPIHVPVEDGKKAAKPGTAAFTDSSSLDNIDFNAYGIDILALVKKHKLDSIKLSGHLVLNKNSVLEPVLIYHASSGDTNQAKATRVQERLLISEVADVLLKTYANVAVLADTQENTFELNKDKTGLLENDGRMVLSNIVSTMLDAFDSADKKTTHIQLVDKVLYKARGDFDSAHPYPNKKFLSPNANDCQQAEKDGTEVWDAKMMAWEFSRRESEDKTSSSSILNRYVPPSIDAVVDFTEDNTFDCDHIPVVLDTPNITAIATGDMSVAGPKAFKNPETVYEKKALKNVGDQKWELLPETQKRAAKKTKRWYCIAVQNCSSIVPTEGKKEELAALQAVLKQYLKLDDAGLKELTEEKLWKQFPFTDAVAYAALQEALNNLLKTQAVEEETSALGSAFEKSIHAWFDSNEFVLAQKDVIQQHNVLIVEKIRAKDAATKEAKGDEASRPAIDLQRVSNAELAKLAKELSNAQTRTGKRNPQNMLFEIFPYQLFGGFGKVNGSLAETNETILFKQRFAKSMLFLQTKLSGAKNIFMGVTEGSDGETIKGSAELLKTMTRNLVGLLYLCQDLKKDLKPLATKLTDPASKIEAKGDASKPSDPATSSSSSSSSNSSPADMTPSTTDGAAPAAATMEDEPTANNKELELQQEQLRLQEQEQLRQQKEQEQLRQQKEQEQLRQQEEQERLSQQKEQERLSQQQEQERLRQQEALALALQEKAQMTDRLKGLEEQLRAATARAEAKDAPGQDPSIFKKMDQILEQLEAQESWTPAEKAQYGLFNHFLSEARAVWRNVPEKTKNQDEALINAAGAEIINFYNANQLNTGPGRSSANIARTAIKGHYETMRKRSGWQKLGAACLVACGIVLLAVSVGILAYSFGGLAPLSVALATVGLAISAPALSAIGGALGTAGLIASAKVIHKGFFSSCKPATSPLANTEKDFDKYDAALTASPIVKTS